MRTTFDHESLDVYQEAIHFVSSVTELLKKVPRSLPVYNQLERASTSIPLNIAEGNGKFTARDRCRFLDIARGSALECSACLDILQVRKILLAEEVESCKHSLLRIVSMLVGLIRKLSGERNA